MKTNTEILLHPIRLRIVQALAGRTLTVAALREALPDVPQASLYRHVKLLETSGLIRVVDETPVGGARERTFALDQEVGKATEEELEQLDRPGLERLFGAFTASLMADFRRYLDRDTIDLRADGIGFRTHPMWLDDDELLAFADELRQLLQRHSGRPEAPGRRRRKISTIILPDDSQAPEASR